MNKKVIAIVLCIITFLSVLFIPLNALAETLELDARSYILMEKITGEVIMEYNADEALPPASITKVMSIFLIYEAIEQGKIKLDDVVTVSAHAASMGGSQVFLEEGEQQKVSDLLKCVIIASANDAVVALGEQIAGTESAFVELMNSKAAELGMNNTKFINACGLDADGHLTSARDVAIVSRELITKYPDVFNYTKIWQDSITHVTRRGASEFGLDNTNRLIKMYPYATGLKTGSTSKAKYCVSATANKDGDEFIAVVMASSNFKVRFEEAIKLLNYAYSNYTVDELKPKGTLSGEIKVSKGKVNTADVYIKNDMAYLKNKSNNKEPEEVITINDYIIAPCKKGTVVGDISYFVDGIKVASSELIIDKDIDKSNLGNSFYKIITSIF